MTAPALVFLAAPGADRDHGHDDDSRDAAVPDSGRPTSSARSAAPRRGHDGRPAGVLRMTRGAREAATGMKIADAEIQRCLDAADDVSPDPNTPSRTRFRRGNLVVLAAADGMVLRVDRRGH